MDAKQHITRIKIDWWIILPFFALLAIGLVMVASASMVVSKQQFGYPFHFFLHQLLYVILGVVAAAVCLRFSLDEWRAHSRILLLICLALLVLVLIPGIGREVNGSRRWIYLGVLNLQVSEFAKLVGVMYLARYLSSYAKEVKHTVGGFIRPLMVLAVIGVLLLKEPDFGSLAVLTVTYLAMLFIAEVPVWLFVVLILLAAAGLTGLVLTSPYRLERVIAFLHPWANQYGSGYQLTQSLIAFGRGGWFGVGLGNSIQKLFYLPEAHTDFLFSIIAEELGLFGTAVIIGLYGLLFGRLLWLAKKVFSLEKLFEGYLLVGIVIWLALQAFINMGVDAGLLPTKGLTLPLISYGGSSMLINFIVLAIILRIYSSVA